MSTCIYCLSSDGPFDGDEHVIPQSFGKFGTATPTLQCVCDDCNAFFGKSMDLNLARQTIEGVSRYAHDQFSSETRPTPKLDIRLGEEAGELAGLKIEIDGKTGTAMLPRPQLHAYNFKTKVKDVFLLQDVRNLILPSEIYGGPDGHGHWQVWKLSLWAATDYEYEQVRTAAVEAGIHYEFGDPVEKPLPDSPGQDRSLLVEISAEIDAIHRRALAKILLNFVAWTLGEEEALKPRWNFVRQYARYGTGEIKWRLSSRPFWTGHETKASVLSDEGVDIRVSNLKGHIVGALRFYSKHTYELILVENDSLLSEREQCYRFMPGSIPIKGDKRPIGATPAQPGQV